MIGTIAEAVAALRAYKPVLVADDEHRENEGDAIISAALATPQWIAWMIRHTSGFLCAPMPASWPTGSICRQWSSTTKIPSARPTR